MNYINGYNAPIFIIDGSQYIPISHNYNFLHEYIEDIFLENTDFNGVVYNKYRYSIIHFQLDFSSIFIQDDALKIQNILLAFYQNKKVELIPHADTPSRCFEISLIPDKRLIALMYGGYNAGGNYGFIINFRTKYPVYGPHWINPASQPVISAESYFEYI